MKLLVAAIAALMFAAPASGDTGEDVRLYLQTLDRYGIKYYRDGVFMVAFGYGICKNLRSGANPLELARIVGGDLWGPRDTLMLMASASSILCPDTWDSFTRQVGYTPPR